MDRGYCELEVIVEENAYADERMDINYPLYKNCYCEALGAILNNIDIMKGEEQEAFEKRKQHYGSGSFLASELENGTYLKHSNIIAFIGARGSGKTTAVNEFCQILSEYSQSFKMWDSDISYKKNRGEYRFYIMPAIDASVLEAKEDLIELIWANMYQVFERRFEKNIGMEDCDELSGKIRKEFDAVYRNYNNAGHGEKREVLGESVLAKLKNVSSSLKTKGAFEKLVNHFLKLLCGRENDKDSYLVITVDDLDLNLEKGYDAVQLGLFSNTCRMSQRILHSLIHAP